MSKFHSTVSRRDFMKGLGLAGAGLGAAAATAPVFHDLDELISAGDLKSNPNANLKRPWYVTEREFKNPTTEVDWSIFQAWDWNYEPSGTKGWHPRHANYKPEECTDTVLRQRLEQMLELKAESGAVYSSVSEERWESQTPGYALRDEALRTGAGFNSRGSLHIKPEPFAGFAVKTPEERGVPKWTGTPEEATNMLRAASHMLGSPNIGAVQYDADTKKLLYPTKVRFEDVDEPGEADDLSSNGVIPNKCQWGVYIVVRQTDEGTKRDPSKQSGISRYFWHNLIMHRVQFFIKSLGYMAPGASNSHYHAAGMNVPLGIMSGIGELCRIGQQVSPEWGSFGGFSPGLVTDLSLAPTKPIDAGIWKFCEACKICAEICHEAVGNRTVISLETEPTWEVSGPWNRVGVKKYQQVWPACGGCGVGNCSRVCPFNTHGKGFASAHEFVKATVATTPIFNGFFTTMGKVFYEYPCRDEEDFAAWWERDLNAWPYDTILGAGSGPNGGV